MLDQLQNELIVQVSERIDSISNLYLVRYFEAPRGYVFIHLGARTRWINHISPRCLKITYTIRFPDSLFAGLINRYFGLFSKFSLWSFKVINASRFFIRSILSPIRCRHSHDVHFMMLGMWSHFWMFQCKIITYFSSERQDTWFW